MNFSRAMRFAVPILLGFVVGFLASQVQAEAIATWYPTLVKPELTPPSSVFPIAWGIIYILSGISLGLAWPVRETRGAVAGLWLLQLVLNFVWCFVFFRLRHPAGGLAVIVALLAVVLLYTWTAWKANKAAGLLYIPYILWVGFATYLNAFIHSHN
ncbi:MAG: tryptophan-rich sensory protein [Planctomycetaceae bacterium]|nr:tryptophan-rich sensory protein [Planctomycetaceae bacterium]